jgi:ubiquinone/menaquinone biosynthesis C-methylase UbiE
MISRIRRYYNAISGGYDALYANEQYNKWFFIKKLAKTESKKVLDIGCGTSLLTRLIHADFLVAMDISDNMIKCGRQEGISYVVANAEKLPFKNNSFDLFYSVTVLQDVLDKERAVSEWRRIAKEGVISVMKGKLDIDSVSKIVKNNGFRIREVIKEEKDMIFYIT